MNGVGKVILSEIAVDSLLRMRAPTTLYTSTVETCSVVMACSQSSRENFHKMSTVMTVIINDICTVMPTFFLR